MKDQVSARTFAELLSDVSEAAFECGEWDDDSNTEYDESHNALRDATAAITDEHDRLTSQVAALRDALSEMLTDAETMNEPYRNEAICERARAALAACEE